jgi:acetoin utilization deacetylase AcuC-like enzyme
VKGNIGHLEAGAGAAGIIKAALTLYHRRVPATLHFKKPNPNIDFERLKLRVVTEDEELPDGARLPYVGVNSFGFGGANAHAILQAVPQVKPAKQRVAVVDFDVHHGDGSEDIWAGDSRVLLCSTYQQGLYPFRDEAPSAANVVLAPLPARSSGPALKDAVRAHWLPALEAFAPELIVVSAGFDAHREDDMGNLGWVESDYAWLTEQILAQAKRSAQGRVVSVLEGGYALSALARSAAAHLRLLVE